MTKRTRRSHHFSLLAALLALMLLLAACGGNGGTTSAASTGGTAGEPAAGGEPAAPEEGEVVSLRWITAGTPQSGSDAVMEEVNALLRERYGLELEFEIYDFGSYDEKMNMIISSGEDYDICFTTQSWLNKYLPNVSKGAFMPLDDLIDTHAPGLRSVLPDFLFEQARVDGSIYAIPNYQICYDAFGFMMRKDLVEKYEFDWESVQSVQDMYPFWEAVRDNEPDLYPLGSSSLQAFEDDLIALLGGMSYVTVSGPVVFEKGDDSFTVDWFPEANKSYRAAFGELYKNGFIRQDILTMQDDSADITSGKYASRLGVIKPGGEVEQSQLTGGYEYVQIAIAEPFINSVAARATMTAVSSGSKNPEAAIRMIEVINSDVEIYNMLNFGVEGVNYEIKDGFVEEISGGGYFYNTGWSYGNQFNAYLVVGQQEGIWEETMAINNSAEVSPISGFTFNEEAVATEMAQMTAVNEEYKFMGVYDDFEARFEEYRNKMIQAGVERYCEEVQSQLDEWLAANGMK